MTHIYSIDFRERAVEYVSECGGDREEVCRVFRIASSTLQRWIILAKRTGDLSPKPMGSRPWKLDHNAVVKHVEMHSDSTLQEIADHFDVVPSMIFYVLKKHGVTRKKNLRLR